MKRTLSFIFTLLLIYSFSYSQKVDLNQLDGIKIRNIGPAGMSGRVTAIDVDLSNTNIIYAGTASGGVWKSINGGISWKPIFDEAPVQSVGAVAINQQNPAEVWVGTGEGNPRNSQNSGEGIYKSIDGGETWSCMGLKETKTIHRIIIDKHNPDIVYAGAQGSAWGPNPERGIFKTTDGGETWEKTLFVNDSTGCADLVVDPTNPNKLIAAMWEFGRKPWFFNSGGKGSGIYLTYDGGKKWKKLTSKDGLPKGTLGRAGLAIAPSKPNIVYALVEAKKTGLYRSTDGGETWQLRSTENIGNRPFYYADIFVDSKNENRIFNLYSYMSVSEDGGKTFSGLSYRIHPDHHAFWIHPEDPSYIIEGNDGGLNISHDGGKSWRFVENLPLAQFYHINYDMELPYNVYGGLQDNGSWVGPSYVWHSGGIRNADFQEILFGDGFDVIPQPNNSRFAYAMSQGGNVRRIDTKTGKTWNIKPYHAEGEKLRFHWNAAIAQNPFSDCGVYFGSQYLHKSLDCGNSWEIISPDLTTNDSLKQQQNKSGGLTIDATGAENHTTIIAIAPSPVEENVIWVGTDDGNVQLTRDGGASWTNLGDRLPGCPAGSWIPQIEVSQKNAGEAFVVVNNYRRNDWRPMVYHTTDFGATWNRIVDEKQVSGHALAIVQDPIEPNLLFLGTDFGLYVSFNGGADWDKWTKGFPSVSTRDLKIHPREHDLIIGTFGRAIWIMDDIRPLREIAKTRGEVLKKPFRLFESPEAYQVSYRSYPGVRYTANSHFIGSNRRNGAQITYWLHPDWKKMMRREEEDRGQKTEDRGKKGKKKGKGERREEKGERSQESGKNMEKGRNVDSGDPATPAKDLDKGKKGPKPDKKITFQVFNSAGDTLRTFKYDADTAINRVYWRMTRKGVRFPSYRSPRPNAGEPGGPSVLPGRYKVVASFSGFRDSTYIEVKFDPRRDISPADLKARSDAMDEFYKMVNASTQAMNQLNDAKKSLKVVSEAFSYAPDSTKEEIKELNKAMQDSISGLQKLYSRPPGGKGYLGSYDGLSSKLRTAYSYITTNDGPPNQSARNATSNAKKEAERVIALINTFFEKDWAEYQKKVEALKITLFKQFEPVKME